VKYIYPPRPETKGPPSGLKTYERMGFIAQPKMNGSCAVLMLDGGSARVMGRHNNVLTREVVPVEDLKRLHRGAGVMVLVGEYLNKSQKDFKGRPLAGFVIFDILVYNGKHLLGSTFQERQELLDTLFPFGNSFDRFMDNVSQNVYRAKNFTSDFESLWKEATKVQMYEGFVLKRPNGILENGFREANNTGWQLKIRKPTKNYKY
jgi:ATP-dependent DNA ligase